MLWFFICGNKTVKLVWNLLGSSADGYLRVPVKKYIYFFAVLDVRNSGKALAYGNLFIKVYT